MFPAFPDMPPPCLSVACCYPPPPFFPQVGSPSMPLLEFLEEWTTENLDEISPASIATGTKVFVNGNWVGIHHEPATLVRTLRELRRQVSGCGCVWAGGMAWWREGGRGVHAAGAVVAGE